MSEEKELRGRPGFDKTSILARIIAELEAGVLLTDICREKGMPAPRTIREWCEQDAAISAAVLMAREIGYDAMAEECVRIADNSSRDAKEDAKGNLVPDYEMVARDKLRIETRLKLLGKWHAKKYGEAQKVTAIGVNVAVNVMTAEKIADLQARKRASILRNRERMAALPAIGNQDENVGTALP